MRSLTRSGVARPARLEVLCLRRARRAVRRTRIALASLPHGAGPHRVVLRAPGSAAARGARGCAALRLRVLAVHGSASLPVGIAEVTQRYAKPPAAGLPRGVKLLPCCFPRKPPKLCRPVVQMGGGCMETVRVLRRALRTARPAIAKLPSSHLRYGHEVARVSDVRWSGDGTVAHYRLWLENEHRDARAVLMGHFVEVATGKVIGRYRLDRAGTLPKAEHAQWKRAVSFEAAARFLHKHRFAQTRPTRVPPAGALTPTKTAPPRLSLRPTLSRLTGRLRVKPRRAGFFWWYEPNMVTRARRRSPGALELYATPASAPRSRPGRRGPRGKARRLARRRPGLEHGFAQQHQRVRLRRRKLIAKQIEDSQPEEDGSIAPAVGVARLFPRVHAFSGTVRLYWHPTGRAVLAVWQDVKDMSSLLPDSRVGLDMEYGGGYIIHPKSWDRLDYARKRAAVTIHPLVPTPRTKLRLTALAETGAPPGQAGRARSRGGHASRVAPAPRPRTGCGCATVQGGSSGANAAPEPPGVPLPWMVVLLWLWGRRRRVER